MENLTLKPKLRLTFLICLFLLSSRLIFANSETRDIKNFTEIKFTISGDLFLTQGNSYSVKIEGNEEDVKNIVTEKEGNSVTIRYIKNYKNRGKVNVLITLPKLNSVTLAGSGNIFAKKNFTTDNMEITVAGSGNIKFDNLNAQKSELSLAGSGNIDIKGAANKVLEINIAGSGDVRTQEFKANTVEVNISGSGSAKVFAGEKLETNIIGSGSVYYKGEPLIDAKSTGSGKTTRLK